LGAGIFPWQQLDGLKTPQWDFPPGVNGGGLGLLVFWALPALCKSIEVVSLKLSFLFFLELQRQKPFLCEGI